MTSPATASRRRGTEGGCASSSFVDRGGPARVSGIDSCGPVIGEVLWLLPSSRGRVRVPGRTAFGRGRPLACVLAAFVPRLRLVLGLGLVTRRRPSPSTLGAGPSWPWPFLVPASPATPRPDVVRGSTSSLARPLLAAPLAACPAAGPARTPRAPTGETPRRSRILSRRC